MTERDTLLAIHELQVRTAEDVGEMRGELRSVVADVAMVRDGFQRQGQALGHLQATCAATRSQYERRLKRISSEVGLVREDTGVIHRDDLERKTKRKLLRWLLAGVGVIITGVGIPLLLHFWR